MLRWMTPFMAAIFAIGTAAADDHPAPKSADSPATKSAVSMLTPKSSDGIAAQRGPLPLVSIRLLIQAGAAAEPANRQGLADFTLRLIRRGTRKMTADQINEEGVQWTGRHQLVDLPIEQLEPSLGGEQPGLAHAARFTWRACGEAVLAGYESALTN